MSITEQMTAARLESIRTGERFKVRAHRGPRGWPVRHRLRPHGRRVHAHLPGRAVSAERWVVVAENHLGRRVFGPLPSREKAAGYGYGRWGAIRLGMATRWRVEREERPS